MKWKTIYTSQAKKDSKKLLSSGLKSKSKSLIEILENNPYQNPPEYKKLAGDLSNAYSRRINFQHKLVYQVLENIKTIKVLRLWTHYE